LSKEKTIPLELKFAEFKNPDIPIKLLPMLGAPKYKKSILKNGFFNYILEQLILYIYLFVLTDH